MIDVEFSERKTIFAMFPIDLSNLGLQLLVFLGAVAIGVLFVVIAWGSVAYSWLVKGTFNISSALYWLTSSVILGLIATVGPFDFYTARPLMSFIGQLLALASFGFLIVSMVRVRRSPAPEKRFVYIGSLALFVPSVIMFLSVVLNFVMGAFGLLYDSLLSHNQS